MSAETLRPSSSLYSLEGSYGWRIYSIDDNQWWVRDQLCGFESSKTFIWFASAARISLDGPSHFEKTALSLVQSKISHDQAQGQESELIVCLLPSPRDEASHTLNAQTKARELLVELSFKKVYHIKINLPGASRSSLKRSLIERGDHLSKDASGPQIYPHLFIDDWVCVQPGEVTGEADETWIIDRAFAMGQTPVTQALYEAVTQSQLPIRYGPLFPATAVSWFDAILFCNRLSELCSLPPYYEIQRTESKVSIPDPNGLGIRLPSRAEWCYAAAGGRSWPYAGSNEPSEVAWSAHNSGSKLRQVARLKHNDFGIYDLSGNIWEWSEEGSRDQEQAQVCTGDHHPKWLLGGSWANHPWVFPIGEALSELPSYRDEFMGFRVVRTLPQKLEKEGHSLSVQTASSIHWCITEKSSADLSDAPSIELSSQDQEEGSTKIGVLENTQPKPALKDHES